MEHQSPVDVALDAFVARVSAEIVRTTTAAGATTTADDAKVIARADAERLLTAMAYVDGRANDREETFAGTGVGGPVGARAALSNPSEVLELLLSTEGSGGVAVATYGLCARSLLRRAAAADGTTSALELSGLTTFDEMMVAVAGRQPAVGLVGGGGQATDAGPKVVEAEPIDPDVDPEEAVEDLLAEFEQYIGMVEVKRSVRELINLTIVEQLRLDYGLPIPDRSHHMVFSGNPGTGKTTVARLLSKVFAVLGVFDKGHLVETHRADLVAGYVGQTAPKTQKVVETALGGVLFIDEAYALVADGRDFGKEAITTLVKLMEDHRKEFMLIAAGYPNEMGTFIDANPGLASRLRTTLDFPDYTFEELAGIARVMAENDGYELAPTDEELADYFRRPTVDITKGNARLSRQLFEDATVRQAQRLVDADPTKAQLIELTHADLGLEPPA